MYRPRCRGSSHTATVLGYSYNCQTAVCTDTCPNQLMKFCPCNGVMRRLASRFRTRKTCSKRHSLPPNKHGGFVATQCHVRCDVMPSSRMFIYFLKQHQHYSLHCSTCNITGANANRYPPHTRPPVPRTHAHTSHTAVVYVLL